MLATSFARTKFHQYTLCISRTIKKVVQGCGRLNTPQAEQTVNQVMCGVKDPTKNVTKIHLSLMAHKKFNMKGRIMEIIKFKKKNYRKSGVKRIFLGFIKVSEKCVQAFIL